MSFCFTVSKDASDIAVCYSEQFLKKAAESGIDITKINRREREAIYYFFLGLYMREGLSACNEYLENWKPLSRRKVWRGYA